MRHTRLASLVSLLSVLCLTPLVSQSWSGQSGGGRQQMRFNVDETVLMPDAGTAITLQKEDNTLRIMPLPIPGGPTLDLKEGDEVGMANGKRVKTIKELREIYEASKPGEEFKLGIKRDGRAQIVTFERKEMNSMPGGGRMVMRTAPEGDDQDVFPALGFGIVTNAGKTTVSLTFPEAPEEIAEGDEVVSINGKKVSTAADFSKELDGTKVGGDLAMTFRHEGKEYTVKMKRPEPQGGMMRMRRSQ